jgi:hypothetical protein
MQHNNIKKTSLIRIGIEKIKLNNIKNIINGISNDPIKPSTVFLGLIDEHKLFFPIVLPTKYPDISVRETRPIKNK